MMDRIKEDGYDNINEVTARVRQGDDARRNRVHKIRPRAARGTRNTNRDHRAPRFQLYSSGFPPMHQ
jgi:hypothetical protein